MRRFLSFILIIALVCGTVSSAAGGNAPGARRAAAGGGHSSGSAASAAGGSTPRDADAPRKREAKSILLWGGLFLANSALLTIGLRDRAYYDDAGAEAEARGEDAGGYREGYDRAGLIVAASGVAALVSGVGFVRALRGRPIDAPLDATLSRSPVPPGLAETGAPAPGDDSAPAHDPVARAIADIEARGGLGVDGSARSGAAPASDKASASRKGASGDRPAPIVMSRVRTQQAWLPGTVVVPTDTSVAVGAASDEVTGAAGAPSPADAPRPPDSGDAPPPPPSPTRYAVQVASHRRAADAEADAARWTERGYPARVVEKDLGALGTWYRVVLGDFARSADAESLADWLRGTFHKQDARVTRR